MKIEDIKPGKIYYVHRHYESHGNGRLVSKSLCIAVIDDGRAIMSSTGCGSGWFLAMYSEVLHEVEEVKMEKEDEIKESTPEPEPSWWRRFFGI